MIPFDLQCEYRTNPLGIDTDVPLLNWRLESATRGQRQRAYQILVSSRPEFLADDKGDLWDTRKVESDRSIHIAYEGRPLTSAMPCYWKVRVWDQANKVSPYSEMAVWETGLLNPFDWHAQWIGTKDAIYPSQDQANSVPMLRKTFRLDQPITKARAYICGLGYFELYLNGRKVEDHVLDPAFTQYDRLALYVTFDVREYLVEGLNASGIMLGNGWYNLCVKDWWNFRSAPWISRPKVIMQLHVEYADGSATSILTDSSWKMAAGPILFDGIRQGEVYDARNERHAWNTISYDDADWLPATVVPGPGGVLKSQSLPPIKVIKSLLPIGIVQVEPDVFVYDLGQNISGWAKLKVSGPSGSKVIMKYGERLDANGKVDTAVINPLGKKEEFMTDTYILKGTGTEQWEPRFVYHGFRYVQVNGFPGVPDLDNLTGQVIHTAFESAGEFACSNELLNSIQQCTQWSYVCNFHGYPTDCPHREKNGWTGDAHLAAEQGLLNFNSANGYVKWMDDLRVAQRSSGQLPAYAPTPGEGYNGLSGPAWDSALILIPWYLYLYCGNTKVLTHHYSAMTRYVDFLSSMATDHILSFGLGDWCPPHEPVDQCKTPVSLTSTSYYYVDCVLLSKIAALLGQPEDAERYADLARQIKKAFHRTFLTLQDGRYASETQTALSCMIYQGLTDVENHEDILHRLIRELEHHDNHLDCGILGTKFLLHALSENGRTDLAYQVATKTTYPSWGHWIQQGATTLWETWDGKCSQNHIMFGDISAWFYKALAGMNPDPENPGFKHTIIRPCPVGDLAWVRAEHKSMYGMIRCAWKRVDKVFMLDLTIPCNTFATVYLPTSNIEGVSESNDPVTKANGIKLVKVEKGNVILSVESGTFRFACSSSAEVGQKLATST